MKIIPSVMFVTACVSLLPFNAMWLSSFFDPSGMGSGLEAFHLALGMLGLALLAGYGAEIAGRSPWLSSGLFWMLSAIFNGGISALALATMSFPFGESWAVFRDSYAQLAIFADPARWFSAAAMLSLPIVLYWMPIAAFLSLAQFGMVRKSQQTGTDSSATGALVPL